MNCNMIAPLVGRGGFSLALLFSSYLAPSGR